MNEFNRWWQSQIRELFEWFRFIEFQPQICLGNRMERSKEMEITKEAPVLMLHINVMEVARTEDEDVQ